MASNRPGGKLKFSGVGIVALKIAAPGTDHPELAPTDRPDLATEARPELDRISRSTASTQLAVTETVRRPAIRCVRSLARAKLTVDASQDLDRLHERALRVATSTAFR